MRRILVLLLLLLVALPFAGDAAAAEVLSQDNQGRQIRFDVRAEAVDVEWYAALLRAAPHGDEISTLRIEVVAWEELRSTCGPNAGGCYSRNVMVVPAEQSVETAHTVVHEYAHHLDRSRPVPSVAEPNGMPEWWRARGIAQLLRLGSVARSYVLGWDRSIAEIFAEDYAQLVQTGGGYAIGWLDPPDASVLAALRADLGLGPRPVIVNPPKLRPVTIVRSGRLAPARGVSVPFGLLGPGRHVTATATVAGAAAKRIRATLELRCDGARVALRTISTGKTRVTIDRGALGPAECTATLRNTSQLARAYTLVVRLSIAVGA